MKACISSHRRRGQAGVAAPWLLLWLTLAVALLALLGAGWTVVLAGRRADALQETIQLAGSGAKATAVPTDVTDPDSVRHLFDQAVKDHGRVDLLFNNAGVNAPGVPLEELTIEQWRQVVDINLNGTMRVCAAARAGLKARQGCIVNTASMLSFFGGGLVPGYSASKGGVAQLTKSLAIAYAAEGIRVNAVRPGIIDTDIHASGGIPDRAKTMAPMIPMLRPGNADEVAQSIVWLLSDAASYVTGANLEVTGGR